MVEPADGGGFGISAVQLCQFHQENGLEAYRSAGGIVGLTQKLRISLERGVPISEVAERRRAFGENRIPSSKAKWYLEYLFDSLKDPIMILLCVCSAFEIFLAFWYYHGEAVSVIEGFSILGTVLLVSNIQAVQDWAKERSFRKLNADVNHVLISVLRDGRRVDVVRYDLVVGDVLNVNVGDILEADGVLISGEDVECDESALTGEPEDIKKDAEHVPFLFAGTAVKSGSGTCLVTAVGTNTMSGKITALVRGQKVAGPGAVAPAEGAEPDAEKGEGGTGETQGKAPLKGSKKGEEAEEEGQDSDEGGSSVLRMKLNGLSARIALFAFAAAFLASMAMLMRFWIDTYGVQKASWQPEHLQKMLKAVVQGIAVVVVAVPEGLPLAVTLALSLSVRKMQKDHNLVKYLDATETMGSATTICSDKTGTLTQNRMTVMRVYAGGTEFVSDHSREQSCGAKMKAASEVSIDYAEKLCQSVCLTKADGTDIRWDQAADRWEQKGNKTDCALLALAFDLGVDYQELRNNTLYNSVDTSTGAHTFGIKSFPFSSSRKRSGQVVPLSAAGGHGPCRIYVKGASEMILKLCSHELKMDGTLSALTAADREQISLHAIDKFASHAMRTIGLAFRDFPSPPSSWDEELEPEEAMKLTGQKAKTFKAELGLTLLGICGIHDPVREGVPRAIVQCNHAGIDVRMVTGDHKATAIAIAKDCGILRRGIDYKDAPGEPLAHQYTAMTGEEFRGRVLDERGNLVQSKFDQIWPHLRVLARSSPEDKYVLVSGLCDSMLFATPEGRKLPIHPDRQVVAVTGDGTNDAPALRRAHVGFAMKITGTRVAQDAADILLLDDNFASVVKACMWGRNVYDSIAKFLQFQLTVNIAAVGITLVGSFVITGPSPLSVVQMIWVNLIMDSLGAVTFASELPTEELLERAPYGRQRGLISFEMKCNMIGQAIYQLTVLVLILFTAAGPGRLSGPMPTVWPSGGWLMMASGVGRESTDKPTKHYTVLFNTFVFMQLFNWINCRMLHHEWNVFRGLWTNKIFILIWSVVLLIQLGIVELAILGGDSGNLLCQTQALDGPQWAVCIVAGAFSLVWQWVIIAVARLIRPRSWSREGSLEGAEVEDIQATNSGSSTSQKPPNFRTSKSRDLSDQRMLQEFGSKKSREGSKN